jgi:hypothetical protein
MSSETRAGSIPVEAIVGPEQVKEYTERSRALLAELQEKARQVVADRPELAGAADLEAAAGGYTCSGKVVFTGALVWERVQVCLSSSPAVRTTTDIWGATLAVGGISWGGGTFSVPPEDLPSLGDLTIQVNIASVAVNITWWKHGQPVGAFVGGGVGIGAGVLGGKCKFEAGSC